MRLPTIASAAVLGLILTAPALAAGQIDSGSAGQPAQHSGKAALEERCDRLSQRYGETAVRGGEDADVLHAEVLHEEGTAACDNGNYRQGIAKIQQALTELGGGAEPATEP